MQLNQASASLYKRLFESSKPEKSRSECTTYTKNYVFFLS